MNKHLLLILLLSPLSLVAKETALDCKWERGVSYDNPKKQMERTKDESVVVQEDSLIPSLVNIQMYGYEYKAERKLNKLYWIAPAVQYESWEYRHELDTINGSLNVTLHQPLAESVGWELETRREPDGTIKSFSTYYKCLKVQPLFDK